MGGEGRGTIGTPATLAPKYPTQPRRAKLCSGPQTLPWGEGSSRRHGLALGGGHAGALLRVGGAPPARFFPPKTSPGLLFFLIAHHSVISPGHSKPRHLLLGASGGSRYGDVAGAERVHLGLMKHLV